jgi:hypothetical protein
MASGRCSITNFRASFLLKLSEMQLKKQRRLPSLSNPKLSKKSVSQKDQFCISMDHDDTN